MTHCLIGFDFCLFVFLYFVHVLDFLEINVVQSVDNDRAVAKEIQLSPYSNIKENRPNLPPFPPSVFI